MVEVRIDRRATRMFPPLSHLPNAGVGGLARMPIPNEEPEGGPVMLHDLYPRWAVAVMVAPVAVRPTRPSWGAARVTYLPRLRVDARRGVAVGCNFCHAV